MSRFGRTLGICLVGLGLSAGRTEATPITSVGVELAIVVDVSGSIDSSEFALQRTGYANAFNDAAVRGAILGTPNGVAASLIYFSGRNQQQVAVGWTHLRTAGDIDAFRAAILAANRPYDGLTAVGSAIDFATGQLLTNDFAGARLVMDVSGDGSTNDGIAAAGVRDFAVGQGITINGLPILGSEQGLLGFYSSNVVGGPKSFVWVADGFDDFGGAAAEKLHIEISGIQAIPEPASLAVLGAAVLGALGLSRRRSRSAVVRLTQ